MASVNQKYDFEIPTLTPKPPIPRRDESPYSAPTSTKNYVMDNIVSTIISSMLDSKIHIITYLSLKYYMFNSFVFPFFSSSIIRSDIRLVEEKSVWKKTKLPL